MNFTLENYHFTWYNTRMFHLDADFLSLQIAWTQMFNRSRLIVKSLKQLATLAQEVPELFDYDKPEAQARIKEIIETIQAGNSHGLQLLIDQYMPYYQAKLARRQNVVARSVNNHIPLARPLGLPAPLAKKGTKQEGV